VHSALEFGALNHVNALDDPQQWFDAIGVDAEVRQALRSQMIGPLTR